MPVTGKLAASALLLALLSGCSQVDDAASSIASTESEITEPEITESETQAPTPTQTESQPEPEQEAAQPEVCSTEIQELMEGTINSQTGAFAEDEFELAYSLASPSFREAVNLQSFVALISASYGPLIESSSLGFSECLMDQDESVGVVDVSFVQGGEDVYALRYLMVSTPEGWRVEGASNLEVIGKGA